MIPDLNILTLSFLKRNKRIAVNKSNVFKFYILAKQVVIYLLQGTQQTNEMIRLKQKATFSRRQSHANSFVKRSLEDFVNPRFRFSASLNKCNH